MSGTVYADDHCKSTCGNNPFLKRLRIYKGCGRGEDVALLTSEGFTCAGRDPAYHADAPRESADVVNLDYVINVVKDPPSAPPHWRKPGTLPAVCWWFRPRC